MLEIADFSKGVGTTPLLGTGAFAAPQFSNTFRGLVK